MNAEAIPAELRERPQWVVWKRERDKTGRWTKRPYRVADGGRTLASITDPATWSTFERALAVSPATVQGVGYVFAGDDPFCGVDLDGCLDPASGELHPAAADVLADLDPYRERSPSGCGLHAIVAATLPGGEGRETKAVPWRHEDRHELAIYDRARFFTMTGDGAGVIAPRQDAVDRLLARFFPAHANGSTPSGDSVRPVAELLADWPELDRIAQRKGKGPKDNSRSGWDHYLMCEGVRCGLSAVELAALLRQVRPDKPEGYVKRTVDAARESVGAEQSDPAAQISRRWNLGDDPIVGGELLGGVIVNLERRSGARLRLPSVDDLFDPRKHTRVVSRIAKTQFRPLTGAQATEIAQAVIALCPGELPDPKDEADLWVGEFIAGAGATVERNDKDGRRADHDVLAELVATEETLRPNRTAAARTAVIRDGAELWLPATALKVHSDARCGWDDFTAALHEIGWRAEQLEARDPETRKHYKRRFYVSAWEAEESQ